MADRTFDTIGDQYFSGQGEVMVGGRDINGVPTGLRPIGNVPELKISVATTVVNHRNSQDGQRGIDARLQTETNASISFTIESFKKANLALALRGDTTAIVSGTVTAETILAYPGLVTGLQYVNGSALVLKAGVTTLVPYDPANPTTPWDYKWNPAANSIELNDTSTGVAAATAAVTTEEGTPTAPMTLSAAYSYSAQSISGALTSPLTDLYLRFEGLNTVNGNSPVIVEVFRFQVDPLKELSLISDTFGQMVLEGTVLRDAFRTSGSQYFSVKQLY